MFTCLSRIDDVSVRTVIGDDGSLFDPFFRAAIRAGVLAGKFYLATDELENTVGMALWFGPGQEAFSRSVVIHPTPQVVHPTLWRRATKARLQ
jgi:hypothetical protein